MPGLPVITALTLAGALVTGLVLALLANLKLALARRTDLTEGRIGWLFATLNLALVPLMLVAGLIVDRFGVRPAMIAGSVLLTLALLALTADLGYRRILAVVLVAATGAALMNTATVVLIPHGLFSVREAAASMEIGMVFMALGALIGSILADLLYRSLARKRTLALLALVVLTPAFIAALPGSNLEPTLGDLDVSGVWLDASVWLAAFVFFIYAPLEAFISVWTTTHVANLGTPQGAGALLLAFWMMLLGSRILFGLVEHQNWIPLGWGAWMLVVPAFLAAVVFGNLMGSVRNSHSMAGMLALGFFLGPIFPSLVALLFRLDSVQTAPGTAYGMVYGMGSLGSLVLSPLVGVSARSRNFQSALMIPLFLALLLFGVSLMFALLLGQRAMVAP